MKRRRCICGHNFGDHEFTRDGHHGGCCTVGLRGRGVREVICPCEGFAPRSVRPPSPGRDTCPHGVEKFKLSRRATNCAECDRERWRESKINQMLRESAAR